MPSLTQRITDFFRGLIPVQIRTRFDPRAAISSLAQSMTVDEVQAIFRAAETGNTDKLFALYRDILIAHSHLQTQFATRKIAVLGEPVSVQPFDKKNPDDVKAKDSLWLVTRHPDWEIACNHLLDSVLWPVAVVEKVYRPSRTAGFTYELARLVPVPHDLLSFQNGRLQIKDVDAEGRPTGTLHEADPHRYIVHRGHLLTVADNWGGPMRSLVFWWLLGTMDREWWARFLDRYGSPFVVGKYDQNDDDSRSVLQQAFALATKIGGLVVTRETDIEIKQAAASDSGQAYERFHAICNEEISKLIVGQTTSAEAKATGLGSSVSNSQDSVRQDIKQFDAKRLGATFSTQLAFQLLTINAKKGTAPLFVWGSISPAKLKAIGDFLTSLKSGGMRVADEGIEVLSERAGLPLERDESAGGGFPGVSPFGVRTFSAAGLRMAEMANESIARDAAATLPRSLGKHFAGVRQIILESKTPAEAIAKVEIYCAKFEPAESARIVEEALLAYAANGSVVHARG